MSFITLAIIGILKTFFFTSKFLENNKIIYIMVLSVNEYIILSLKSLTSHAKTN